MKVVIGGVETPLRVGESMRGSRDSGLVDVVLAFDTTASMTFCIQGMRRAMVSFAEALETRQLDWRMSCVPFGDLRIPGDRIVTGLPWVNTVDAARCQLAEMPRFAGGGNGGESSYEALVAAVSRGCRRDALRVVVLVTDDLPHQDRHTTDHVRDLLVSGDSLMYAVTSHKEPYTSIAESAGGQWVQLTNGANQGQIVAVLTSFADGLARRCRQVMELGGGSVQRLIAIERGNA